MPEEFGTLSDRAEEAKETGLLRVTREEYQALMRVTQPAPSYVDWRELGIGGLIGLPVGVNVQIVNEGEGGS